MAPRDVEVTPHYTWQQFFLLGGAGTMGGGVAGIFGGLLYGLGGTSEPLQPAMGAASILLVLVCLNILIGLMAGAGVGFGVAAAGFATNRLWQWRIIGGALGGLVIGGFARLFGFDAFNLLFGRAPLHITGAAEGMLLGGAVGFGAWFAMRAAGPPSLGRRIALAALVSGVAGILVPLLGGRLMGGSLDLLTRQFPGSRLRLDYIGSFFGENGFGFISQVGTGAVEGVLFGGCLVGAMCFAQRSLTGKTSW